MNLMTGCQMTKNVNHYQVNHYFRLVFVKNIENVSCIQDKEPRYN